MTASAAATLPLRLHLISAITKRMITVATADSLLRRAQASAATLIAVHQPFRKLSPRISAQTANREKNVASPSMHALIQLTPSAWVGQAMNKSPAKNAER